MNGKWPAAVLLGLMTFATDPDGRQLRTVPRGVFCATPFQLRKAIVAARHDDGRRLAQLGCMRTGTGMAAVLLWQPAPGFGPWQVRLTRKDMPPVIMWGYASGFEADVDEIASDNDTR